MIRKKVLRKYVYSFALIIILLTASQIFIQYLLTQKKGHAKVINLAGRQRMLSQRLIKFLFICQIQNCDSYRDEIVKNLDNFHKYHYLLMSGGEGIPAAFTPSIQQKYKLNTEYVEDIKADVECILNSCKRLLDPISLNNNTENFLKRMDEIVFDSQDFEEKLETKIKWIEIILFLVSILVIIFEVLVVFIPMNKKIISDYEELKAQDMQLLHQAKLASLGTLISSIVHEIKNPLSVISGYQKVLEMKTQGNEELGSIIQKQNTAVERIVKIIESMRQSSRREESQIQIIDLGEFIKSNIDLIKPIFAHKGVTFIYNNSSNIKVQLDANKLNQILINLISNAADAMENSEKKIIEIGHIISNKDILLSFRDSGQGIPKEIQSKIFEEFFTTKTKDKGTGLGLNIVKKTLDRMNSTISIDHSDETGTTFLITLKDCIV